MPIRVMYHTQEKRGKKLTAPIICLNDNAWLGEGYYFWYSESDAIHWGITSKRKTGYYEVYKASIDCANVLDTVFNEEHYLFWVRQIEKAAEMFLKKGKSFVSLKEINDYFRDKGVWTAFDGIMFQDISKNPEHYYVKEFQYKKRIQIAVYNLTIISNFAFHFEGQCI